MKLRCIRNATLFGREFSAEEVFAVEDVAYKMGRDPEWLYKKLLNKHKQVGRAVVPCFEAVGGGDEADGSVEEPGPPPEVKTRLTEPVMAETDPVPAGLDGPEAHSLEELGIRPKYFGFYELPSGKIVRGEQNARDELAQSKAS